MKRLAPLIVSSGSIALALFHGWAIYEERLLTVSRIPGLGFLAFLVAACSVVYWRRRAQLPHPVTHAMLWGILCTAFIAGWLRGIAASPAAGIFLFAAAAYGLAAAGYWLFIRPAATLAVLSSSLLLAALPFQVENMSSLSLHLHLLGLGLATMLMEHDRRLILAAACRRWLAWCAPFLALLLISSIYSVYPYVSVKAFLQIYFGSIIAILVAGLLAFDGYGAYLIHVIALSGSGLALAGLLRLLERIVALGFGEGLRFRVWPMDTPPNYAAFHLVLILPFAAVMLRQSQRRSVRLLKAVMAGVMIFYILISFARISWLSLAVEVVMGAALLARGRLTTRLVTRRRLLVALLLLATVAVLLPKSYRQRLHEGIQLGKEPRLMVWRDVTAMVRDYPWLGTGLATKRFMLPAYQARTRPFEPVTGQYLLDAHSTFMELVSAAGIPALAAFMWLLIAVGRRLTTNLVRCRQGVYQASLAGAGLLAFAAYVLDGFVNFRLLLPGNAYLMWFVMGVAMTPGEESDAKGRGARRATADAESTHPRKSGRFLGERSLIPAIAALTAIAIVLLTADDAHQVLLRKAVATAAAPPNQNGPADAARNSMLAHFKTARFLNPFDAHPNYLIGVWQQNFGKQREAATWFRKAVELNPVSAFYCDVLGTTLMRLDDLSGAAPWLEKANELEPYHEGGAYRCNLGVLRWRQQLPGEALEQFTVMTAIEGSAARAVALLPKETPWAVILLERLRTMAMDRRDDDLPLTVKLYTQAALGYEALEQPLKALQLYAAIEALRGPSPEIYLTQSRLLWRLGYRQQAAGLLQAALELDANNGIVLTELGIRDYQLKSYSAACETLQLAMATWGSLILDNHLAHQYLVLIARALHDAGLERRETAVVRFLRTQEKHQVWEFGYHFADIYSELKQYQLFQLSDAELFGVTK